MKTSPPLFAGIFLLRSIAIAIALGLGSAHAADQTWNNSAGDFLWNNSSTNWSDASWTPGNGAIFGATGAGAITVDSTQSVTNMTFNAGAAGYSFTGGTLSFANTNAGNTINVGTNAVTISSGLSAAFASSGGSLVKAGTGTLTLNGDISLTAASGGTGLFDFSAGTTEITGGTINTTDVRMRTLMANGLTISGGTFNLGGANANRGIQIGSGGSMAVSGGTVNVNSFIIGNGSSGILNLSGGEVNMTGLGTNLRLAAGSSGAVNATLNLNGGTLATHRVERTTTGTSTGTSTINLNGGTIKALSDQTTAGLFSVTGTGTMAVNVLSNGAIFDSAGFNVSITNALVAGAGAGGLTKNGAGTLTLTATNTYVGATTINAGSLTLGANGSVGSSSVLDVASGATLDVSAVSGGFVVGSSQTLGGNGTIVGDTTISGTLSPGNSIGALTFANNLTLDLNSTSVFQINGFTAGAFDLVSGSPGRTVAFGGALNIIFSNNFSTSGSVKIFDFENYSGGFGSNFSATGLADGYSATFDDGTGLLTVVPEPSTYALLVLAAAGLMAWSVRGRWMRRRCVATTGIVERVCQS